MTIEQKNNVISDIKKISNWALKNNWDKEYINYINRFLLNFGIE